MTGKEQLAAVTSGLHFVEIDGTGVEAPRTFTDKQTGMQKPLPGRQTAFLWQGSRYPIQISVDYTNERGPHRPGLYLLSGAMFEAGKFGRVEFRGTRDLELIPLADALVALSGLHESDQPVKSVKAA